MPRKHAPRLVNPEQVVRRETDRALGVPSQAQLRRELERLARRAVDAPTTALLLNSDGSVAGHAHPFLPIMENGTKWDHTAQTITSTTGTTVGNLNTGILLAGVPYQVTMRTEMAANAPSGFFIYAVARIEASGTNTDGMDTGTVNGERTLVAYDQKIVIGTGATINIAGRARVTGGSGSINSGLVSYRAIPLITSVNNTDLNS